MISIQQITRDSESSCENERLLNFAWFKFFQAKGLKQLSTTLDSKATLSTFLFASYTFR